MSAPWSTSSKRASRWLCETPLPVARQGCFRNRRPACIVETADRCEWRVKKIKRVLPAAVVAIVLSACTPAAPVTRPPAEGPGPAAPKASPLDALAHLSVRSLLPDGRGEQFIVLDGAGQLYRVGPGGQSQLGKAPDLGLVAAWGPNDTGYAFARRTSDGTAYEIVGVGHEGSKVLAVAAGYPGAMHFQGQELHFIDAQGWKVVGWSAPPAMKAPLPLGPRANQKAWCAWLDTGPLCVGGYWDGRGDSAAGDRLTVVRAGAAPVEVLSKGRHPILAGAAFTNDGRKLAANLGARSAGSGEPGRVVVAWLDDSGRPVNMKEFPMVVRELGFDAYRRLVVRQYPGDGSGQGRIVALDPETGQTSPVTDEPGSFVVAPGGKQLYLISNAGLVRLIDLKSD